MKIKTQVSISLIVFVILAGLIIFSVYSSNNQLQEITKKQLIIDEIEKGSFELYYLEYDYLLHGGTRPIDQWHSKYNLLSGHLEELTLTDPSQQAVFNTLLDNYKELQPTFSNLVAVTGSAQGKEPISASQELKEFAASTLTGQTQTMISKSSELSQMMKAEALQIQQRNTLIISASLTVLMLSVLLYYLVINSSVLRSISTLQKGTEIIGSGNLDAKIETGHSDELGDLSQAFNRMTVNLKAVTASKSDLEKVIAKRKRAEEELARSNRELQQFAYVSSHDLQEPLRMISSFVQLLEKRYKGKLDQDADEFIGYIVEGTSRMQRMIQDLLTVSRVQTRRAEFAHVDTNQVFEKTVFNLQVMINEAGAVVTKDELPTVMGDETQLIQLFQNLIDNAIKFRRAEETPKVHISAQRKGNDWEFSVKDNGIGIDPQYFDRIFIIFQRLHSREAYEGTGIGLAVCMRIVELHGGRIWVKSEPGRGSIFHFTLSAVN